EADSSRADVQLGAAVLIGPEAIARAHRAINDRCGPIVYRATGGLEGNRALRKIEPSDAAGRIIIGKHWTTDPCRKDRGQQERPRYTPCAFHLRLRTLSAGPRLTPYFDAANCNSGGAAMTTDMPVAEPLFTSV